MNDAVERAKEEIGVFQRPSVDTSKWLMEEVERLEKELARYSMSAGSADQYRAEAMAARASLGFSSDSDEVSPSDIAREIANLTTTNRG